MSTLRSRAPSGWLPVGDGHELYYDVSGNPQGKPQSFFTAVPAARPVPRFFDPDFYRIVIVDQRAPPSQRRRRSDEVSVENARSLKTSRSCVSTLASTSGQSAGRLVGLDLALAYAQAHPTRCPRFCCAASSSLGPTVSTSSGGTFGQSPQAWRSTSSTFATRRPTGRESTNLLGAYWQRLTSDDAAVREAAAAAFVGYELHLENVHRPRRP